MLLYVILSVMLVLCGAVLDPATRDSTHDDYHASIMQALSSLDEHLQAQINTLVDQITTDRRQVAFYGTVGVNIPASQSDQIVKYQQITTDTQNAYRTSTGVFQCPASGLYLFSSTIISEASRSIAINMYQNGNIIARPYTGSSSGEHISASDTAVVHANVGDEIYLKGFWGSSTYLDNQSRFVAVLLKAD